MIVTLQPNISRFRGINKSVTDLLNNIAATSVEDLSAFPEESVDGDGKLNSLADNSLKEHYKKNPFMQILYVKFDVHDKQNVLNKKLVLDNSPLIYSVSPNIFCANTQEIASFYTPAEPINDPRYNEQWALSDGYDNGGMGVPDAWAITKGSKNIRVGIIDTGIAVHKDLEDSVDRSLGGDFFHYLPNKPGPNTAPAIEDPDTRHGTLVAGIIAAKSNNGIGISGIAPNTTVVPLKVDSSFNITEETALATNIRAINYASTLWGIPEKKISILNYSYSGYGFSNALPLLTAARNFPGLFVWSAGNQGENIDKRDAIEQYHPFYMDNVISVGARDKYNNRSIWAEGSSSNYGKNVDIYAPGGKSNKNNSYENILSTTFKNDYVSSFGTSLSAPYVAGVAALMLSVNPNLTAAQLKELLIESADDFTISTPDGPQRAKNLNAYKAVHLANPYKSIIQDNDRGVYLYDNNPDYYYKVSGNVPSEYAGQKVTSIANIFHDSEITKITVPDSVTEIRSYAFSGCTQLTDIRLPEHITKLETGLFNGCSSLKTIPMKNITEIGQDAFKNCSSLTEIDLSQVTEIQSGAFDGCTSLTEIDIGRYITTLHDYTFANCTSLAWITTGFVESLEDYVFLNCRNLGVVATSGFSAIGKGAFMGCAKLGGLDLSKLSVIEQDTFNGCISLSTDIGKNTKRINARAFYNCKKLSIFNIPDSLYIIDDYAFYGCEHLTVLPSVESNNIYYIGESAFEGCTSLQYFTISETTEAVQQNAFKNCGTLKINWYYASAKLTAENFSAYLSFVNILTNTIGNNAFKNCNNLIAIDIPYYVKAIGNGAFYNCTRMEFINYEAQDCEIESGAFYNVGKNASNLDVEIFDGVLTVPNNLLDNTKNLKSIHIPCSVTSISEQAFVNCSGLESLTVDANNNIYKSDNNCIIKKDDNVLVAGCKNSIIPEYVSAIGNYAFAGSGITELVLPNGISTIGNDAFNGCESLVSIDLSENLISLSAHAFTNCKKLTNLTLPQKLKSISDWAFSYCESLTEITIPSSVQSMGKAVFLWCKKLQTATFEDGCTFDETAIGIFYYCTKLNTVNLPNSITVIPREMFYHCLSLKNVNFGNNSRVQQIKTGAFFENNCLTSIALPESLEHIQYSAFTCDNLLCIYLDKPYADSPITVIDESALSYCNNFSAIIIQNPISAENHKLANLTYADNIIADKSIIWSGISDCVDINSLPYTEDLQINNTVLLCEIYENLHNYANDKENYKYEADYILNRITNNYECNGVLIYTDMDDESTKILIELFYEFSIPFIVITDDLADIDNGITLSRDYFSIGYNVAKSYYDFLSENDNLDLYMNLSGELLYCPIVAENYYKSNIPFLLGASQIFEYPVVVLSFDEFKYKFGNEENTDSNKNYADTVPTTTQFYQWLFFSLKNESFIHETMSNDVSDWVFFYYDCDIDFCYMFNNAFVIFDYACEIAETTLNNLNAETMDYSNYMF